MIGRLARAGVLGINRRGLDLVFRLNPRRAVAAADDKLVTKSLCAESGILVPETLAAIAGVRDLDRLDGVAAARSDFVLKPARGIAGRGVCVVTGRSERAFARADGREGTLRALRFHAATILAGLHSLGGRPDRALVEERLGVHPSLAAIAYRGTPDVRVVVVRGVPVMAMLRLPTRHSGGRSNLKLGAVAVGLDLATGTTTHAVQGARALEAHPDTGEPVRGVRLPAFFEVLRLAASAADACGLGFAGADVVLEPVRGPLLLEINARPGLSIQIANRRGLVPAVQAVAALDAASMSVDARVSWAASRFGEAA